MMKSGINLVIPRVERKREKKKEEEKGDRKQEKQLLNPLSVSLLRNIIIISKSVKNRYTNEEKAEEKREKAGTLLFSYRKWGKGVRASGAKD